MQKPLSLSLAVILAFTGCSAFKKSHTWQHVVDHRADRLAENSGKSTYPERLHEALAAKNVPHKIVTYQYRYRTPLREEAVGTGKAVFYRDETTPGTPWWVMDETTSFPVWVPNETVDRQVSFFLQHRAEVLAEQDFSGTSEGKTLVARAIPEAVPGAVARSRQPSPKMLVRAQLPVGAAAQLEDRFEGLFRTKHGTAFDPASSIDRAKMEQLRQERLHRSAGL